MKENNFFQTGVQNMFNQSNIILLNNKLYECQWQDRKGMPDFPVELKD